MTFLAGLPGSRVSAHWGTWLLQLGRPGPRALVGKGCSFQSFQDCEVSRMHGSSLWLDDWL